MRVGSPGTTGSEIKAALEQASGRDSILRSRNFTSPHSASSGITTVELLMTRIGVSRGLAL
jgi:hypothetical protein